MSNVIVAVAVLAYFLYRQFQPRQINEGRTLVLPLIVIVAGIAQGGIVDRHHESVSVALLAVEAVAAVGLALYRAYTMRIWRDAEGRLWRRGSASTAVAWLLSIGLRVGLLGVGAWLGIKEGQGGVLLFLGVTLLIQNLAVRHRATLVEPPARVTV